MSSAPFWRLKDFWRVEIAAFVPRVLFLIATYGMTKSDDVYSWQVVSTALFSGTNPYATTTYLNWPPFWMQVIYLLKEISTVSGLSFVVCVFSFLLAAELTLLAALYVLLQKLSPGRIPGGLLLWTASFNPVLILLTCQHGNFDVLVALGAVVYLLTIVSYQESGDPVDWLLACAILGVAILIKTTPLALAPLLFYGMARLRLKVKFLGGLMTVGPVLLGMSIIYVLAPHAVTENVLNYRSLPGYFGITGLLDLMNLHTLSSLYALVFPPILTVSLMLAAFWFYQHPRFGNRKIAVLVAAMAMLALPLFGPGYAPQYLFWSIPLLTAAYYSIVKCGLRLALMAAYGTATITYIVEYSFFFSHGALALQIWHDSATLATLATTISDKGGQTLVRLPLFIAMSTVFAFLVRETVKSRLEPGSVPK